MNNIRKKIESDIDNIVNNIKCNNKEETYNNIVDALSNYLSVCQFVNCEIHDYKIHNNYPNIKIFILYKDLILIEFEPKKFKRIKKLEKINLCQ